MIFPIKGLSSVEHGSNLSVDNNNAERSMLKEGSEFVYERLFRFSAPALATFNMNDGTNWTLNRKDATLPPGENRGFYRCTPRPRQSFHPPVQVKARGRR
jgi:hypothetical protein